MRWDTVCVRFRKVAPQKTAETDAIFAHLEQLRQQHQADKTVLRLSMDAKATVLIGNYSRGGKSRLLVKAADHDFHPSDKVTPYGIFLPEHDRLFLYFTRGPVTSDFIVDCLLDCWLQLAADFPDVQTLVLLQDNGPENHSRRTQFMQRITHLADQLQRTVHLLYYPPYHSKYNPVERVWGRLEQHWDGDLLDSATAVLNFAQSMTWQQRHPVVTFVHQLYHTGVRLAKKAMASLEQRFDRLKGLEKYSVRIRPLPSPSPG
jgi:hypothetical protein